MRKTICLAAVVLGSVFASNRMDYSLEIPGEDEKLYWGLALISEGRQTNYIEGNHVVYANGAEGIMSVQSHWEDRQGIRAELISSNYTLRATYFDTKLSRSIQRYKNGTTKEDFFRKEDLFHFLELGVSSDDLDFYFQRDFNNYGTFSIAGGAPQAYSSSMMKLGLRLYDKEDFGSIGIVAELQRYRTLRLLRIGYIGDDGTTNVISTRGPFNKTVDGFVAGIYKSPDPTGRFYITYTFQGTVGVSESPFENINDIGIEGYYLKQEYYDLLANLDGSVITGLNSKFGGFRIRASLEAFIQTAWAAPASNVYPIGVNEDNVPPGHDIQEYREMFSEEYTDYAITYGYSAQIKILF